MSKAKLTKYIKYLKEVFKSNDKAMGLLSDLENEAQTLEFISQKKSTGEFPPPENLGENGFAVYSDGACRGNPGPGAWGMVAQSSDGTVLFYDSGVEDHSTNNRMELQGAIEGLTSLIEFFEKQDISLDSEVRLVSDSKYVLDGISKWVPGWKARGWKKADKKEPENVERWKNLDEIVGEFSNISYEWVRGHQGHPQNEYCDQLANLALDSKGF
jgi:ribonuclease HI